MVHRQTKMLDPIDETPLLVVACVFFFYLFYGQFQTYFMEIQALFLKIHNFKRLAFGSSLLSLMPITQATTLVPKHLKTRKG
jgi:hypothetical protein